jgi:drug/metabolite transporter (DMT)-like permease
MQIAETFFAAFWQPTIASIVIIVSARHKPAAKFALIWVGLMAVAVFIIGDQFLTLISLAELLVFGFFLYYSTFMAVTAGLFSMVHVRSMNCSHHFVGY